MNYVEWIWPSEVTRMAIDIHWLALPDGSWQATSRTLPDLVFFAGKSTNAEGRTGIAQLAVDRNFQWYASDAVALAKAKAEGKA